MSTQNITRRSPIQTGGGGGWTESARAYFKRYRLELFQYLSKSFESFLVVFRRY